MDEKFTLKFYPFTQALRLYHKHEVHGLDNIPAEGGALIASTHSLATYDISLLMAAVYEKYGRMSRSLIDRAFYKFPGLGELMEKTGAVMGTRDNARDLLSSGELVFVAPGGMREALRPSSERYQFRWDRRQGFVALAFECQVPIILAACPKADDIFQVYETPLTKWVYKKFRLPFFVARGAGLTPLPRPVQLRHFVSEPIIPPKPAATEAGRKRQVTALHKKVVKRMEELMATAVAYRERSALHR